MVALKETKLAKEPKSTQELKTPLVATVRFELQHLKLESTIRELSLYDFQIESSHLGKEVSQIFQANPLLPGAILTDRKKFAGMISRCRFLERLSSPYGLELFLKRPLYSLYRFASTDVLILSGELPIVEAARRSLQRPAEILYEPVVVELAPGTYRLLDVHQLLIAQSHIHQLTTELLHEQTEAQMMQTEKMASLGKMVTSVAHEIKNPVNCIISNFEFLSNYCQDLVELVSAYDEEISEISPKMSAMKEECELEFILDDLPKILKSIEVGSERLGKIVGGLQNFSHLDESKLQPANLHECIGSALIILNNRLKYGIELIERYGDIPPVNCYSGQLSQVFVNLIGNAIDALFEKEEEKKDDDPTWKPQITISTELVEQSNTDWVSIKIADNGPGIPSEIQERVFENFFTTKPVGKGTGLGLAISHQIVTKKHAGKLFLKSQPKQGTEFEILLPLLPATD